MNGSAGGKENMDGVTYFALAKLRLRAAICRDLVDVVRVFVMVLFVAIFSSSA